MARGSYTQSSFLGGEWSPSAGARLDLPTYRTALDRCRNAYPFEEGAISRRSGFLQVQPSRRNARATILPYLITQGQSTVVELTVDGSGNSWVRSYTDGHVVTDGTPSNITATNGGSPVEITLGGAVSWVTGDDILCLVEATGIVGADAGAWSILANRQLTVTKIDTTHFTLTDALTGANINGSGFTGTIPEIVVDRITTQSMPYNGVSQTFWDQTRPLLAQNNLVLLVPNGGLTVTPLVLTPTLLPSATEDMTFSVNFLDFLDGPYLGSDNGSNGPYTISATSGAATFTVTDIIGVNNGSGFLSTDAGRSIRINQVLPFWNSGVTYSAGQTVSYPPNSQALQYTALPTSQVNLDLPPPLNPSLWAPLADAADWNWMTITTVNSTTSVNVSISNVLPGTSTTAPIVQMQMGKYTNTGNAWPSAATFFEGRLLFGLNEDIDASAIDGFASPLLTMSPTDAFGNVLDSSGFSFTLVSPGENSIYWMFPDSAAVIIGTAGSEWVIQASQLGDPLTPTSFQAHQVTQLGSQFLLPVRPGIALTFVNRYSQRLIEYLIDPFTSKYSGKPLNVYAQHLGVMGQVQYQDAPNPMIWSVSDGGFQTCTYRRVSYFASETPTFYGWGLQTGFAGGAVTNSANAFINGGLTDAMYAVTSFTDGDWIIVGTPPFTDNSTLPFATFVDFGNTGQLYSTTPARYEGIFVVSDGNGHMVFNGLIYNAGSTLSVFYAGLDFGDHVVSATGTITVPYASDTGGIGTLAYIISQAVAANTPGSIYSQFNEAGGGFFAVPGVVGFGYTTTIKLLRPDLAGQEHNQTGDGAGELKRHHWYSINTTAAVTNTVEVSVDDGIAYPATFYQNGSPVASNVLFSGVHRDTIECDYSLDNQITFTISRPVPFNLASVTGFLETEEL